MGTPEDFHTLVSEIDYPMFIVTTAAGRELSGCLVGFATQASIEPPRLLVMLSKLNHTFGVAQRSDALAVHFLNRENHRVAALFGEQTGDQVDKFAACSWEEGPLGTPVLPGTRGWVVGHVLARWDVGDHVGHLLDVAEVQLGEAGDLLTFQVARTIEPGHPA
jgi:flavin reductase (DIM6/NTAB) family NADH-FMN oxidoreductase RutF